jgi:hypothetical protein
MTDECPYCHGGEDTVEMLLCEADVGGPELWVSGGEREIKVYVPETDILYGRSIYYCPRCGRRLTEEEQS